MFLRAEQVPVERKQFAGQAGYVVWIGWMFSPDIVVEHQALGGLMDMRLVQVHAVALDGVGDAADEDHGAIWFQPLDDSHMGQRIVQRAISVEIPCIIEKHEIAWVDSRLSMKGTMVTHMVVNESDAVPFRIIERSTIQIDPVLQEDGTCHPRTVVGDPLALACNGPRSDEPCRRLDDG